MDSKQLGEFGECAAAHFLLRRKYSVLARNFKVYESEIDLVVRDFQTNEIVFVEVKTRTFRADVYAEESVNPSKLRKICIGAEIFLLREKMFDVFWRVDVVIVEVVQDRARISHLINVSIDV